MTRRTLFYILMLVAALLSVWAVMHLKRVLSKERNESLKNELSVTSELDAWTLAVAKVKVDRSEEGADAIDIPPELKHYSERHWFLATQVAEIARYRVHACRDYIDLAAMVQRGDMVSVPKVTNSYVLFGVGAQADDDVFTRYEDDHDVALYDEVQLNEAYRQLDKKGKDLQSEISSLKAESGKLSRRDRSKQRELLRQVADDDGALKETQERKALLDRVYGQPESRQRMFSEYQSFQTVAKHFRGQSYDLEVPADRTALKINLLSSLRPESFKILEALASVYSQQFGRPLPVSSLVRPEQYQQALHRVNRNAVLIDSPPHSTGLAFDIDYRYMSGAEQAFLMSELARLKREGRIEVIREWKANFHVFSFINGTRPGDDLIAQYLDEAGAETSETGVSPIQVKSSSSKARRRNEKHPTVRASTSRR